MGLQEARDILFYHMTRLESGLWDNYSYEKYQVYEAVKFAVDRLDREIASYCNLP